MRVSPVTALIINLKLGYVKRVPLIRIYVLLSRQTRFPVLANLLLHQPFLVAGLVYL